jgi:hypothetical protein
MRISALAFLVAVVAGSSCATFTEVRTLEPGQVAASLTVGGPLVDVPGAGDIPAPNPVVELRYGIAKHVDVEAGAQVLPLVFGDVALHAGGAIQLFDQPNPWVPALTGSEKLYVATNVIDFRKAKHDLWGMAQTDLVASWNFPGGPLGDNQLAYAGAGLSWVTSSTASGGENLFLSPLVGVQLVPAVDWLRVQLEARWLAPYINTTFAVVDWIAPGNQGGILVDAGVAFLFGGP